MERQDLGSRRLFRYEERELVKKSNSFVKSMGLFEDSDLHN